MKNPLLGITIATILLGASMLALFKLVYPETPVNLVTNIVVVVSLATVLLVYYFRERKRRQK